MFSNTLNGTLLGQERLRGSCVLGYFPCFTGGSGQDKKAKLWRCMESWNQLQRSCSSSLWQTQIVVVSKALVHPKFLKDYAQKELGNRLKTTPKIVFGEIQIIFDMFIELLWNAQKWNILIIWNFYFRCSRTLHTISQNDYINSHPHNAWFPFLSILTNFWWLFPSR